MTNLILLVFITGCLLFPAFLIFRSKKLSGWRKTRWVTLCIASFYGPSIIAGFLFKISRHLNPVHQTKIELLGDMTWVILISGLISILMPWVVYKIFKIKHPENFNPVTKI